MGAVIRPRGRVLVVDDDAVICELVATTLAEHGYPTRRASDAREAIYLVQRETPDVVLLDTAPIADSPTHPPSFCRIYAHRRHACFGILLQVFPRSGGPIELRCMLNGFLDEGWSVGVSNGKPMAASALVRRPRAIGILFPTASPAELLSRFLAFRDRVGTDLGLRPIADTSLATYIQRTRESLVEISGAMKKKNIAVGLGQFYSRKLGLASQKSQRVWLGDYPALAEQRREAGGGPGFSGAALFEESS